MEGDLKKWVNIVSGWQNQYFILHDELLTFCEKKGSETKGVINLKIAKLVSYEDDPLRIAIFTGMSEVQVRASTLPEKVKWYEAMRRAQEKARKEEEETPNGDFEIQVQDGRFSVGNKDLINENDLDRIVDDVSEINKSHEKFNDLLAIVQAKLSKQSQHAELAKRMESLGKELKVEFFPHENNI
jgi:PH domain